MIYYHDESDCHFIRQPGAPAPDDYAVLTLEPYEIKAGTLIEGAGLTGSIVRPSMDFETYSESGYIVDRETKTVKGTGSQGKGGLPAVGTPVYAEHPTTEILCLYYDMKDGKGVRPWIPGLTDLPRDLIAHIAAGGQVEAFNFTFEFWIWNMVGRRDFGLPPLQIEQGVCIMARSRRYSLPGSLDAVAGVLGLEQKQADGKALVRKLTRPHKPTKNRPEFRHTPRNAWDDFKRLYTYCAQDVHVEDLVAAHVPELSEREHRLWIVDQRINARGVLVDMHTLKNCIDLYERTAEILTKELQGITAGNITGVGEVEKMKNWLNARGLCIQTMGAEDVEDRLAKIERAVAIRRGEAENPDPADVADAAKFASYAGTPVQRVLEIRQALAGANIKKLFMLARQVSSDGALRDQYIFFGAATGRWSAGGVQLQNLTAKGPKTLQCKDCDRYFGAGVTLQGITGSCPECGSTNASATDWLIGPMCDGIEDINKYHDRPDLLAGLWPDAVKLISGCLRGLFVARPGKRLVCCDFSAIEAVVLACLSGCQWRIDVFATHGKIYEMSAAAITGKTLEYYLDYKKTNGTHHPDRKKIGKVAELASGYGGWIGAWKAFGATQPDGELKDLIIKWREASPEIVEFWGGQFRQIGPKPWDARPELFGLEGAFIAAVQNPGKYYHVGPLVWAYSKELDVCFCRLPSGRFLQYHRPRLAPAEDRLKRGPCVKITFELWNTNSQKGRIGWIRDETYGGKLCENVTQAVAADIQGDALMRCEERGYPVVMHTHDEIIAEMEHGRGSWEEMANIMAERPEWASWWPIKADGWEHQRYQKD